jgi:endonuclease G
MTLQCKLFTNFGNNLMIINLSVWTWAVAILLIITVHNPASAHPGATNAEGCHTNRKTGEYHCHPPHSKKDSKEDTVSSKPIDSAISHTSADIARTGDLLKLDYEGFTVAGLL